jgi:1-deoxy-D-xylulose-5-phosphate synthase
VCSSDLVVLALDRAGIVGADGATHIGAFDIAFLRCVPNLGLITPSDENECRKALSTAFARDHAVAVRYPRGAGVGAVMEPGLPTLPWGKGQMRRTSSLAFGHGGQGRRIAILAFGTVLHAALDAAATLDASVADMRFVKPLDEDLLRELAASHDALVTVEEGVVMGGAGSAVAEFLNNAGLGLPMLQLGLPDHFVEHGDPARLTALVGLDAAGIEAAVRKRFVLPTLALVKPVAGVV